MDFIIWQMNHAILPECQCHGLAPGVQNFLQCSDFPVCGEFSGCRILWILGEVNCKHKIKKLEI